MTVFEKGNTTNDEGINYRERRMFFSSAIQNKYTIVSTWRTCFDPEATYIRTGGGHGL
jgi:hypothetical protein